MNAEHVADRSRGVSSAIAAETWASCAKSVLALFIQNAFERKQSQHDANGPAERPLETQAAWSAQGCVRPFRGSDVAEFLATGLCIRLQSIFSRLCPPATYSTEIGMVLGLTIFVRH